MKIHRLLVPTLVLASTLLIACGSAPSNSNSTNTAVSTPDHSKMDHSMGHGSADAAKADYDLQFIDTMIEHHQAAIEMAKMLVDKGGRAELRKLGAKIGATQQVEIDNMRSWREKWFAGQSPAVNHELAGMAESMKNMDMNRLGSLSGNEFDAEFVKQMIPHHVGAVVMAREALNRSQKDEIKKLAEDVIREQQAEIEMMQNWQKEWSGK